jgi:hypothetical protein
MNRWPAARSRRAASRARPRGADGHLAVVDSDHRSRSRLHEGDIIQAVTALQVHDLGRAAQYLPQEATLRAGERGAGGRLRQEIAVLVNILLRCRLPGHPVRPRRGVHNAMLMPAPPARQAIKTDLAGLRLVTSGRRERGCSRRSRRGVSLLRWAMNDPDSVLLSVRAEARQLVAPDYAALDGCLSKPRNPSWRRWGRSPQAWIALPLTWPPLAECRSMKAQAAARWRGRGIPRRRVRRATTIRKPGGV